MKKIILSAITGIALLAGCQKSPVNVGPPNEYSTSNYPASTDDLNSILAACYSNLRDPNLFGFEFLPKAISNATHTVNSVYGGDASWNQMAETSLTNNNTYVEGAWQVLFTGVKNCNVTLAGATYFDANYAKPADTATVNLIRGQAYFLRAFYYFELECLFGEDNVPNPTAVDTMGVPLFTGVPASLAAAEQPRSSIKTIWAFIESDLQEATTLLHGQVWTGNDLGRVTEWSAQGLLGKAYVFTKDYADAKTVLLNVINNSGKSLMPYDEYLNSFIGIPSAKFNQESLFEINIDSVSNGDYGVYGSTPNSTSIMGLIWCPWSLGADGTEGSASPMGYGNEIVHDKNVVRFGFNLGYYNLVSNPNFNSAEKPAYNNPALIMDPAFKQASLAARTDYTVDPRLYVNCLQPWVDSVMPDGKTWYPVSKPNYLAGQVTQYGWSFRKYAPVFNNINNLGPSDVSDIYLLRLADVYLLYAEACMNSGDNTDALDYLNMVKRRAYGLPVTTASAIDYKSLTDVTPAANANDPVLGNNPLYYERWAELFNEGEWWFDICRWHLGASEAAFFGTAINATTGPLTFSPSMYAWPIPLTELNSNPKIVNQQNPGY